MQYRPSRASSGQVLDRVRTRAGAGQPSRTRRACVGDPGDPGAHRNRVGGLRACPGTAAIPASWCTTWRASTRWRFTWHRPSPAPRDGRHDGRRACDERRSRQGSRRRDEGRNLLRHEHAAAAAAIRALSDAQLNRATLVSLYANAPVTSQCSRTTRCLTAIAASRKFARRWGDRLTEITTVCRRARFFDTGSRPHARFGRLPSWAPITSAQHGTRRDTCRHVDGAAAPAPRDPRCAVPRLA